MPLRPLRPLTASGRPRYNGHLGTREFCLTASRRRWWFQWKLWCVYPMRVAPANMKPVEWPIHSEDREIPRDRAPSGRCGCPGLDPPAGIAC